MLKKYSRFLALLLAFALVITTFGSDLTSSVVLADEGEVAAEQSEEVAEVPSEEPVEEATEDGLIVEDTEEPGETLPEIFERIDENNPNSVQENVLTEENQNDTEDGDATGTDTLADPALAGTLVAGTTGEGVVTEGTVADGATTEELNLENFDEEALLNLVKEGKLDGETIAKLVEEGKLTEDAIKNLATVNESQPTEEIRVKAFFGEAYIDGLHIILNAEPRVLPDDAVLQIDKVETEKSESIEDFIDEKLGEEETVEVSYSYDINIYSESYGGYVQPEDGTVEIVFEQVEAAKDEDLELAIYHVEDDLSNATEVAVAEESDATEISLNAEHFSIYTIIIKRKNDKNAVIPFNIKMVSTEDKSVEIGDPTQVVEIIYEIENYGFVPTEALLNYKSVPQGYSFVEFGTYSDIIECFRLVNTDNPNVGKVQYTIDGTTYYDCNETTIYAFCRPDAPTSSVVNIGFNETDFNAIYNGGGKVYVKKAVVAPVPKDTKPNDVAEVWAQNIQAAKDGLENVNATEAKYEEFDSAAGVYVYSCNVGETNSDKTVLEIVVEYNNNQTSFVYGPDEVMEAYARDFTTHISGNFGKSFCFVVDIKANNNDISTVPVAVYATDGTTNTTINPELQRRLGLNYIQSDSLYPVGVAYLPANLFSNGAYLSNTGNKDTVKSAVKNSLDTSYLQGAAVENAANSVAANLDGVDFSISDWNKEEYNDEKNGSSIALIGNTYYKYHLELKFGSSVSTVRYYGVYSKNGVVSKGTDVLYSESFITNSEKYVAALSNIPQQDGYAIIGLYTDSNCDDMSRIEPGSVTTADDIYIKYLIRDESTEYLIEYCTLGYNEEDKNATVVESVNMFGKIGDPAVIAVDTDMYKDQGYLYRDTRYYTRAEINGNMVDTPIEGVNRNKIFNEEGKKLVIKVFYRQQEKAKREEVWFFIHIFANKIPTGWTQTTEAYLPENGNQTKDPWKGTATNIDDLKLIKNELKDAGKCNYYEEDPGVGKYMAFFNWTAGIDALSNYTFNTGTEDKINETVTKYTAPDYNEIPAIRQGEYKFSVDDVLWYVYKRQNANKNHIDGYVSTYITYNPGFETTQSPYVGAKVRFATQATVLKNQFTRDGFVFTGWQDASGVKYEEGQTIDALDCKLQLYATWAKVDEYDGSYKVEYYYQKKNGSFNTTADESTDWMSVAFDPTSGETSKNVEVRPADNVRRLLVNYHFDKDYSENRLTGTVYAGRHELILKVYYFRDDEIQSLIVKAKSDSKEYNGTPLTNAGYDVFDGKGKPVTGVEVKVTGSQLDVGTSDNLVTEIRFGGNTYKVSRDANNQNPKIDQEEYDSVTIIDGELKVTPVYLRVTAANARKTYGDSDPAEFYVLKAERKLYNSTEYVAFNLSDLGSIATYDLERESGENVLVDGSYYPIRFVNQNLLNTNYVVDYINGRFDIDPRPIVLRSGDNLDHEFTGEPITNETVTVIRGSFVGNDNVYVRMDPESYVIMPGESKIEGNKFEVTGPAPGTVLTNYTITNQYGSLSVKPLNGGEKKKLIISVDADTMGGNSKTLYYDGQPHNVDVKLTIDGNVYTTTVVENTSNQSTGGFEEAIRRFRESLRDFFVLTVFAAEDHGRELTSTITLNGVTFTVGGIYVYGGEGIDVKVNGDGEVDSYPVYLDTTNMNITVNDLNVTGEFEVEFGGSTVLNERGQTEIGTLTILPRPVTLTSGSDTKVYDGTPLTKPGVEVTGMGFVQGEVANIRATGSVTDPGPAVKNTIEYDKVGNYKDINYIVTLAEGDLVVTPVGTPETPPETPTDPPVTPPTPTPTPATPINPPAGAVLGATRPLGAGDGAAVLGARRGRTEDTTNTMGRVITIIVAAGIGFMMIFIKRKKNEE